MAKRESIQFFSDYSYLDSFLRTNNYWAYYQKTLPPLLLQKLRRSRIASQGPLRILDVGCGSGEFSIPIFEELARQLRVEVTAFDPSMEAIRRFRQAYKELRKSILVDTSTHSFEGFPPTSSFDLIFVAHSLYAPFETSADRTITAANVCRKLRLLTAPSGLICVIMAVNDSMLYELKREAYAILTDGGHFVMTGDLLLDYMQNAGMDCECQIADTYVDVSDFFVEDQNNTNPILWLSYLLRLNVANLDRDLRDRLLTLVKQRALRFGALPESVKPMYRECPALTGGPTHDTRILFHKEMVLISQV